MPKPSPVLDAANHVRDELEARYHAAPDLYGEIELPDRGHLMEMITLEHRYEMAAVGGQNCRSKAHRLQQENLALFEQMRAQLLPRICWSMDIEHLSGHCAAEDYEYTLLELERLVGDDEDECQGGDILRTERRMERGWLGYEGDVDAA